MYKIKLIDNIALDWNSNFVRQHFTFVDDIHEADAVIVRSSKLTMENLPKNVKVIARAGIGYNNIPVDACADRGTVVTNTPGANANAVKELVITGLLMSSRNIGLSRHWLEENKNNPELKTVVEKVKSKFKGCEISGKTLGIIGLGKIGTLVANAAVALGMRVIGYDPHLTIEAAWHMDNSVEKCTSLKELFSASDFITVHIPLLDSTRGLVDDAKLTWAKKGVTLLNFAREEIVDQEALVKGLQSGKIYKYVSDFPTPELMGLEGTLFFPHLGASTFEAEQNCGDLALSNVYEFLKFGHVQHGVNYPNIAVGPVSTIMRLTLLHRNVPNMVGPITTILANFNINIADMTNKSRGGYAYTLIDIDNPINVEILEQLKSIENMLQVHSYSGTQGL